MGKGRTKQDGNQIPRPASKGPAPAYYLWSPDGPDCTPWAIAQRRRTVRSASSGGHGSGSRFSRPKRATCSASAGEGRQPNAHSFSFLPSGSMRRLVLPKSAPRPGEIDHHMGSPSRKVYRNYTPNETRLFAKWSIRRCLLLCFSLEHVLKYCGDKNKKTCM